RPILSGGREMGAAVMARQRAMERLGASFSSEFGEKPVLLLSNPYTRNSGQSKTVRQFEAAGIKGFKLGFGEASRVEVVFPEIRPEYQEHPEKAVFPPNTKTPLSFLMEGASLDQLAVSHPNCELIVSLIGLPVGIDQLDVWKGDSHRFGLLLPDLRVLGSKAKALEAFKRGKIAAVVVDDPQSQEALVIDSSNVEDVLSNQPQLLGFKRRR
ncbi:hypothetical protein N8612_07015, partial [Verrucomicrobia bacterium]|nr:hypothetical protein [Verrucomicrobiota bacterium]